MTTRVGFGDEGEESGDAPSWGSNAGSGWGDSTGSGWGAGHSRGAGVLPSGGGMGATHTAQPRPQRSQGMVPSAPSTPMTPSAPAAPSSGQPGEVWHGAGVSGGYYGAPTMFNGMDISNAAYEDGGEVPEFDDPNADAATLDPMQIVKAALSHGRKKMGLPETFYPALDTQSFDDGGMVENEEESDQPMGGGDEQEGMIPEQPQAPGQGSSPQGVTAGGNAPPVNPKALIQYMGGAGGVAPDVVSAMERQVDPAGAMDASQRFMAVLGKAPSPDVASGILQYGRARYNMLSAAAKASLSKGDFAGAAGYATQAFANVPTGHSIQFAPSKQGLVMSTKPHGAGAQKPPQGEQSFDDGGEVDEEYDTIDSGPPEAGGATEITPQQLVALFDYDRTVETAASAPQAAPAPSEPPLPTPQQPQVPRKRPESRPAPKRDLNANPYKVGGLPPADPGQEGLPEASRSRPSPLKGIVDTARGLLPGNKPEPYHEDPGYDHAPEQRSKPEQGVLPAQGATEEETPKVKSKNWEWWWKDLENPSEYTRQDLAKRARRQGDQQHFEQLAGKLFPWASQDKQRSAYIAQMLDKSEEHASKENIAGSNNQTKQENANVNSQTRREIATNSDIAKGARQEKSISANDQKNSLNAQVRLMVSQMANAAKLRGQDMAFNQDFVNSPEYKTKTAQLSQETGKSLDEIHAMVKSMMGSAPAQGQQGVPSKYPVGKVMRNPSDGKSYIKRETGWEEVK